MVVPQLTTAPHRVKPESRSRVSVREKGKGMLIPDVLMEGTGFDQEKQQQNDFSISKNALHLQLTDLLMMMGFNKK